ncbi:MAG TPA: hypothetical protein VMZ69_00235 [Saprospiraceae bacterium]|nr:hypothetical protein [Saprospiraceae bacterium]
MNRIKSFLRCIIYFLIISSFSKVNLQAQLHVGTYGFAAVGIGGPITDNIDLEGKLFANSFFNELGFEGAVMFDLRPGSFHQFSIGGGFNVDLFENDSELGIVFPFELEIYPLTSFRRLALLIELAPQYLVLEDNIALRHLWGIRYYFKDPN